MVDVPKIFFDSILGWMECLLIPASFYGAKKMEIGVDGGILLSIVICK